MKKYLLGIIGILVAIVFALFLMWRTVSNENSRLERANATLTENLTAMQHTLSQKLEIIDKQNKKYQEILNSIEYNEYENLPVSVELVNAAKELQK